MLFAQYFLKSFIHFPLPLNMQMDAEKSATKNDFHSWNRAAQLFSLYFSSTWWFLFISVTGIDMCNEHESTFQQQKKLIICIYATEVGAEGKNAAPATRS